MFLETALVLQLVFDLKDKREPRGLPGYVQKKPDDNISPYVERRMEDMEEKIMSYEDRLRRLEAKLGDK